MPEYVDVKLFDKPRGWAELSIEVDGKHVPLRVIKNEEVEDGWETTWRVQLNN